MYCSSTNNAGFIELVGPIQQLDLTSITIKTYPISISFAPRTTAPTLIGNTISESTENTCIYKSTKYHLANVQICSVIHKGYILPGKKETPIAELILSFYGNTDVSGVIMSVPIYNSGELSANGYIDQLLDTSMASCNYTTLPGSDYNGENYQENPSTSLTQCVKTCCNDTKCLAYTFKSGKCHLKNSVQPLSNTGDNSIVSGTINRAEIKCNGITTPNTAIVPTLESIFTSNQPSFAYKTCFETFDENNPSRNTLYVFVFPNGIHMAPANYQQLLLQLNGSLPSYMIPDLLRGSKPTLQSYTLVNARKTPKEISYNGVIYAISLSSCSDDFKNRFEFFTLSPKYTKTPSTKEGFVSYSLDKSITEGFATRQYKCESKRLRDINTNDKYKCMTFDTQAVNDGTNTYLKPNDKMIGLNDILSKSTEIIQKEHSIFDNLTTEETEKFIAVCIGSGLIVVSIAFLIIKKKLYN